MENRACRILAARQAIVSAFERVFTLKQGEARLGVARRGQAWQGKARWRGESLSFTLKSGQGVAGHGWAGHGKARRRGESLSFTLTAPKIK
jgi:hypothetical protein